MVHFSRQINTNIYKLKFAFVDMSQKPEEAHYLRPEDRIYQVATDKNQLDWKGFLYDLLNREGLDPWDIDLSVLTRKYLEALKEVSNVDFDISGKLLTIAVFLLKTKAEVLVERDIRGIQRTIEELEQSDNDIAEGLDSLESLDVELEALSKKKREKYELKMRNPLARKRKVNIFDLIKVLEKTFEQSNRRRKNFLLKNSKVEYDGPMYEKKSKDLKTIIQELLELIEDEFKARKAHVEFSYLTEGINHKMGILEKFIPLLHLHNQEKVRLEQDGHFDEIKIHKIQKGDKN